MRFGKIRDFLKKGNKGTNILLTGIPRSGTTLACQLLCDFSQTIALNEPMDKDQFENAKSAQENIRRKFQAFRKSLLLNGTAIARTNQGKITDNAYSSDTNKREKVIERSPIVFEKKLDRDFTLIMKHNAEFSLLLPCIAKEFTTYAIIRNPLAILASWTSVDLPVSKGKVAKSAQLNPAFHEALNAIGEDILQRQIFILSWYFGQYKELEDGQIIRYEQLIESPLKTLSTLAKGEPNPSFLSLKNKNSSDLYNKTQVIKMGETLLNSEGNFWNYYTKEEVIQLLQKIKSDA